MIGIVVGGGKVGFYLARTLIEHGHEPRIIEKDKACCRMIANSLDIPIICGDGTYIDVRAGAGIDDADALISVTGKDEDNLITCQLAKRRFHVQKTVAKINNPKNAGVMKQLGVDIPISSTDNIARLLEREVDTALIKQLIAFDRGDTSLNEFEIPIPYKRSGIKLSEMKLPEDIAVVSIIRDNELIIPRGNTQIFAGAKIMVVCKNKALHRIAPAFGVDDQISR